MSRLLLRSKKIGDLMGAVTNRPCPACGSSAGDLIYRNRMLLPENFGLDGDYDIVYCGKCGCCYADVTSSEEDYNRYYRNHNIYGGWQANSSSSHDIDVVIRSIEQLVDKDAKIIDIGFGNGKLLCKLRDYGYADLLGIDPSEKSVEELEKKGITCKVGSIYNTIGGQDQKADVVIFAMVLEHLLSPYKAIEAIRYNFLKPDGGYLIVTWPYFDDLIADSSPISNNFNHEHINYFSRHTADVLFNRCGFKNMAYHISLGVSVGDVLQFSNIAVYGRSVMAKTIPVVKDERTANSIREYINRVSSDEEVLLKRIEEVYNSKKEIVIWGVGSYFYHLMKVSFLSKCKISFLVDGNIAKQGSKVFDYEVKAPDKLKSFKGVVLVTSMLYGVEIKAEIASMKNGDLEIIENR